MQQAESAIERGEIPRASQVSDDHIIGAVFRIFGQEVQAIECRARRRPQEQC